MIARLFNAPTEEDANIIGTSTIGSSEAIMVRRFLQSIFGKYDEQKLMGSSWAFLP